MMRFWVEKYAVTARGPAAVAREPGKLRPVSLGRGAIQVLWQVRRTWWGPGTSLPEARAHLEHQRPHTRKQEMPGGSCTKPCAGR